jgi:hypothetical protein
MPFASTSAPSSSDALTERLLATSFPDLERSYMDLYVEESTDCPLSDIMLESDSQPESRVREEDDKRRDNRPEDWAELNSAVDSRSSPTLQDIEQLSFLSVSPVAEFQARPKTTPRRLDSFSPDLVAKVKSRHLINVLKGKLNKAPIWIDELAMIFNDQAPNTDWCAFTGTKWPRTQKHVCRPGYSRLIDSLADSILERCKDKSLFFSAPGRVTIFTVPKDADKLRLIANCVELNKLFGRPPRLLFATMSELFMILAFFKEDKSSSLAYQTSVIGSIR